MPWRKQGANGEKTITSETNNLNFKRGGCNLTCSAPFFEIATAPQLKGISMNTQTKELANELYLAGSIRDQKPQVPVKSAELRLPVRNSWMTLIISIVEAVCVFTVAAAKTGLVFGSAAVALTGWTLSLHQDVIRIPLLLVAIVGSLINLYLLLKAHRLRTAPSAAWRKRPLTAREHWRIALVFSLSVVTLALGITEIYFHRLFHHTLV